jgi:alpha-tubulin suppressor-like RCC1 family protein
VRRNIKRKYEGKSRLIQGLVLRFTQIMLRSLRRRRSADGLHFFICCLLPTMLSLPDTSLNRRALLALLAGGLGGCGGGGAASGSSGSGGSGGTTPTPQGVGTVAAIAAGSNQSVALRPAVVAPATPTYSALMSGDNTWGQLGSGAQNTPQTTMTALALTGTPAPTWRTVAAGGFHTLAIRSDGTLWAWGLNTNGQLGLGSSAGPYRTVPTKVGVAVDWLAIAAGESHSLALGGTPTVQSIFSWGQNTAGQLGSGNTLSRSTPTKLTATATFKAPWIALAANRSYSMALQSDNVLFSWGDDLDGQLGQLGSTTPLVPTAVALSGQQVIAVSAGEAHVLAIAADNTLLTWGNNAAGQLGQGNLTSLNLPTQLGTDANWFAVSAGGSHSLAIKFDRTLWAWGANNDGQLGDGSTTGSLVPIQVGTNTTWVAVAAGRSHSLAIDIDGRLWVWGRNAEGQLGSAAGSAVLTPRVLA